MTASTLDVATFVAVYATIGFFITAVAAFFLAAAYYHVRFLFRRWVMWRALRDFADEDEKNIWRNDWEGKDVPWR